MIHRAVVDAGGERTIVVRCECGWRRSLDAPVSIAGLHVAMTGHAVDVLGPDVAGHTLVVAFDEDR